jgi:hypothetical protein
MTQFDKLDTLMRDLGVGEFIDGARQSALARSIASVPAAVTQQSDAQRLPRYGYLYETQAIAAYDHAIATQEDADRARVRDTFRLAFDCWRALASLPTEERPTRVLGASPVGSSVVSEELRDEPLPPDSTLAVRLAVAGLAAQRPAETRLELERFRITEPREDAPWRDQVAGHVANAFVRLVRKGGGWADVEGAMRSLGALKELQRRHEEEYLAGIEDPSEQTLAAVELVGFYHLAQLATIAGEYVRAGAESSTQVNLGLDRHRDRARAAFRSVRQEILVHLADLFWVGCRELTRNAIWTHLTGLGDEVKRFGRQLAGRGQERPVLELWPSQQEALRQSLLDVYRRAILVEMPTSAGKTLLAKFVIVQTKALYAGGTIVYVVPTRALVNQLTVDLRADLGLVGMRVEQTVPAVELDPMEERLLGQAPDVMVTTPEKLDLLIRRDHVVTRNISLVIADEAHNLRDEHRGGRLELLLGMIKRDRADARFLLLSPFLPNDRELVTWLGDDRALPPIRVDWKPSNRIVGAVSAQAQEGAVPVRRGRGFSVAKHLVLDTLSAADNVDIRPGLRIPIGGDPGPDGKTLNGLTRSTIAALRDRGSVLVLCEGPGTATTRAIQIRDEMPERGGSEHLDAVCHYLEAEVGRTSPLVECLRRGVAYHHAGLSQEARWLIEGLVRVGHVDVVCGTTTLAQGVNFPITTVIVETLDKGDKLLTYEDFWNIAGRAGRAMVDTLGVVAFPVQTEERRTRIEEFLEGEAQEISSQLAGLIDRADEIALSGFTTAFITNVPALRDLMQFLAHAMRVSGTARLADEVEDLLRASLVYRQAQKQGGGAAERLVRICQAYLAHVEGRPDVVALADTTGFTTPSVLLLRAKTAGEREFTRVENWDPERLFGRNVAPLAERVRAIADLPEMRLGVTVSQPFNPERIAAILRDWVAGETLGSLAAKYPIGDERDRDKQVTGFSKYLFRDLLGRASWGMGALEGVCLAGADEGAAEAREEAAYVPSMIHFGVDNKEAVWLRMAGVPRVVAGGLAGVWRDTRGREPESYDEVRAWVGGLDDAQWREATPGGAPLTPRDLRILWREFAG